MKTEKLLKQLRNKIKDCISEAEFKALCNERASLCMKKYCAGLSEDENADLEELDILQDCIMYCRVPFPRGEQ